MTNRSEQIIGWKYPVLFFLWKWIQVSIKCILSDLSGILGSDKRAIQLYRSFKEFYSIDEWIETPRSGPDGQ